MSYVTSCYVTTTPLDTKRRDVGKLHHTVQLEEISWKKSQLEEITVGDWIEMDNLRRWLT
ncbi:hypothetical protein OUZ56_021382 [Daphnia magna]|uniref:Uncharacterized protein n=1 Tax=Daphnia magna TaxID=35525 RepID=A0ABQ9ZH89_9CRUS|nr:hypothetical protein OUZ56_021382 [Daphnia magna]